MPLNHMTHTGGDSHTDYTWLVPMSILGPRMLNNSGIQPLVSQKELKNTSTEIYTVTNKSINSQDKQRRCDVLMVRRRVKA